MKIRISWRCSFLLFCAVVVNSMCVAQNAPKPSQPSTPQPAQTEPAVPAQKAPYGEDWTDLNVYDSSLRLKRPLLAETDDDPHTSFIRERYQVEWRPGEPFDLYVIRPRGVAKPPVILYLYSFPEDTEQFKNNVWCDTAVNGGYAAVGFVGAVTGHRMRYHLMKDWFVSNMPEALGATVHDVQLILDYLSTRNDMDSSRVGMFASGSGGSIAIMASAVDARLQVIDLLAPWGDWPTWLAETKVISPAERPEFTTSAFAAAVAPLEPITWLPKMKAKVVRMQNVRGNKAMPDSAQEKMEAAAPDFVTINQFGNGQALLSSQRADEFFQWIKDEMKANPQTQVAFQKDAHLHVYPAIQVPVPNWPNVGTLDTHKPQEDAQAKQASEKDSAKPASNPK
ncbi:MAG TPA: hypothetical protein VMU53_06815 [Candidatus Sulfotelmatobacter sp.]|nr:hypothetical protein [Candidatus Sulfotelmatobacter sp.]